MSPDASASDLLASCPRVRGGVEWQKLPLTPQEGFLLSRIDGRTSVALLVHMSGLGKERLISSLARLAGLGAIDWDGPCEPVPGPAAAPCAADDPALEEACDLSRDEKLELLRFDSELPRLSHWQVLGISGDASTAAVKRAYFAQSRRFHPDRYFGRNLGSFRARVERIFMAVKTAYEVLSDTEQRRAYAGKHPPPANAG